MTAWQFTNLIELEALAREKMDRGAFEYISGGADDEFSLRRNREDFARIGLRPRYLVDVSNIDTTTTVLGEPLAFPVMLAPTAGHKLCCSEGEVATARAAASAGVIQVLSTLSTTRMEDVAEAVDAPRWFQLYVYKDREVTRHLVERAEAAGYRAICVTVDVPAIGNRERDRRNAFTFPPEFPLANLVDVNLEHLPVGVVGAASESGLGAYIASKWDPSLTWADIDWIRSLTRLPVAIKGLLTAEDAVLATEHGAAAVIVSNHGGRQLDGAASGIAALPEVAEAVGDRLEVQVDGGFRRGTDVLKALALGARAVLIGRPYMYALAVGGGEALAAMLEILRQELVNAMALTGRTSIGAIDRSLVYVMRDA
jgi:4-hydroxymandelate oxidase